MQRENWTISEPRVEATASGNRVTANVCGQDVWFEGRGLELRPAAEAFASVFAQHAQAAGATLEMPGPVDPVWRSGMEKLAELYTDWWGYPAFCPVLAEPRADTPAGRPDPDPANAGRLGQCFTGGIDSFYSLLHGRWPCHGLVYVHGYDIPIDDTPRMDAFRSELRSIADQRGKYVFELATNLRDVALFRRLRWEETHGPAIAAAGLLLRDHLDGLVVPPSFQRDRNIKGHGSHWKSDPLHSTHDFAMIHDDADLYRHQRAEAIAPHPLVQKYLRVCWENRARAGNCSRCEKCLRTMASLEAVGCLESSEAFRSDVPLGQLIEGIEYVEPTGCEIWLELKKRDPNADTGHAIDRLLIRSRWPWSEKWTTRQYHRVRKYLGYLLAG